MDFNRWNTTEEPRPWLIQRATGIKIAGPAKVSDSYDLDYMGSSEFEWGAVPNSIRGYHALKDRLQIFEVAISPELFKAKVYLLTLPEHLEAWKKVLAGLYAETHQLKEHLGFGRIAKGAKREWDRDNFWFDVENPGAFSLDRKLVDAWLPACAKSVEYMDEKKKMKEAETEHPVEKK